ncbi:hypothetical protein HN51_005068 [Arachis hypogaea]|uniref:Mitochondrial glycoprotein n=2 Tax=Arachis TaxID=3817 RepID=A0A445DGA7_ARAHY|nr:uncharacterized protein At2g39795, mitochondrial [Arachis duranensis]XP_025695372.1 uncharacterized protein At2g39795, mitochondrial [Arachis hypogaea]XP_057756779.1 uncharacterized protein At2g39795, mitochondrial-like [Arachis stenosperma]QHO38762.1 uncharacterized protein DS421_4g123200 [Arachis hypogaea]RYR62204.1 hypothetical protein Ahy_A04g019605 [Arachis hypogaea]
MAMYTALRRASSAVIPLALRRTTAPSSSRTFHSVLSAGVLLSGQTATRTVVAPSLRVANSFATKTSADENLVQVLESEIKCAYDDNQSQHVEIPDDFPFEIEDNPGERTIQLKRQYQDETIKVQVDIPNVALEGNEEDDDEGEKSSESSIPLVVSVFKGNGVCLEFGVTAFPDEITIDSLSVKNVNESEDQLAYEGPEFTDLDENLQKAFHKYLEIRGIKPSTTNFLQEYMFSKDNKEYLGWLKNLKNFVEQ